MLPVSGIQSHADWLESRRCGKDGGYPVCGDGHAMFSSFESNLGASLSSDWFSLTVVQKKTTTTDYLKEVVSKQTTARFDCREDTIFVHESKHLSKLNRVFCYMM